MSADLTFVDWDASPALEALLAEADRKMYVRKRQRAQSLPGMRAVVAPVVVRERDGQ